MAEDSLDAGRATPTFPGPAPAPAPAAGAYEVWVTNKAGTLIDHVEGKLPDPSADEAVDIYYGLRPSATPPPKAQTDLQVALDQILGAVKILYPPTSPKKANQFRIFYTRIFRAAQLGLDTSAMPEVARVALDKITSDLIDAEGGRVKNAHLSALGLRAVSLAGLVGLLYLGFSIPAARPILDMLDIEPTTAGSFMLLWVGCCGGVWLSYAIRTTSFTLRDLVVTDADRLLPLMRLLFACLLTTVLGLLLALGFADASIGNVRLSSFTSQASLALLLGLVCGVSELLLPSMIAARSSAILATIKQ